MAAAVSVWLVLIVVPAAALVAVSPPIEAHVASGLEAWMRVVHTWAQVMAGVQFLIGYTLAGALALEDPVVGSTAFWMTRPIANGRLLAGKLLAALLLFVVAPVLALAPVWIVCGFGFGDSWAAAVDVAHRFGSVAIAALAVASLVRTLPHFLFASIVVFAAFQAGGIIPGVDWRTTPVAVRLVRHQLVYAGVLPMLAVIAAHQFLTRRTVRTWTLLVLALVAAAAIRSWWPWQFPRAPGLDIPAEPPGRASEVVAESTFSKPSGLHKAGPGLLGTTTWSPDRFHVPVLARSSERTVIMRSAGRWESDAGLRLLGFTDTAAPLRWALNLSWRENAVSEEPHVTGTIEIWSVRSRILGEVPVQVGGEIAGAGHRSRIIALVRNEDRLDQIFVEEIESRRQANSGWSDHWPAEFLGTLRHIDRYYVVNRAAGKAVAAFAGDLGRVEMNSVTIRHRAIGVTWPQSSGEPVLVKVRFECVERFGRPFDVRGVVTRGRRSAREPERKP